MWAYDTVDITSRSMAFLIILAFLACTAFGSMLPEFGNILATKIGIRAHSFNVFFLTVGLIGVGVALYIGHRSGG